MVTERAADGGVKNWRPLRSCAIFEGKGGADDGDRYEGQLYITTLTGVQVFNTEALSRHDQVPRQPANAAFAGPDKRVLYITAREGLYRVKLLSQGPDRVGK